MTLDRDDEGHGTNTLATVGGVVGHGQGLDRAVHARLLTVSRWHANVLRMAERDNSITVRLSVEEQRMVKALASIDGISASDVVRMLVRRAYAARFDEIKPKGRARR